MLPAPSTFTTLDRPYLLVTHIPYHEDERGDVWLDRLWHRDLVQHLSYLTDLTLCAPRLPRRAEADLARLEIPDGVRLRLAPLPPAATRLRDPATVARTIPVVWRAAGGAEIVHSGVATPLLWLANVVARLRGRRLVVVVESPWRRGLDGTRSWRTLAFDAVADAVARWSCRRADVALFTQDAYRETLHRRGRGVAYVTPAVWVNDGDVLGAEAAATTWARKSSQPVRLLFAGRLEAAKGVDLLLTALRVLEASGVEASVDIVGAGSLRAACAAAAAALGPARLRLLDPVPYGAPFFELVRDYHGVLVPSLSDEQPRVVFDANAQAVPVIASDTDGLRPHVEPGSTGWLVPRGDGVALAHAIERAAGSGPELRRMGMAALERVRGSTHREMHRRRSHILGAHLGQAV
jgi:glycosyltransferase involved in cell wall biosynthesis